MNWVTLLFSLLTNPAMAAILKDIEALLQQKTSAQGMAAENHEVAMKEAVNEAVAKRMK